MDSTAAEDGPRQAKRVKLTPPASDDADDVISGLDDDVLLRILGMVADVRDTVRTGALSRRWLGLWTRVPVLSFASRPPVLSNPATSTTAERCAALKQFASVVDDVLGRRTQSADCAVESLVISYTTDCRYMKKKDLKRLTWVSAHATQGWMQYVCALPRSLKHLILDLNLPYPRFYHDSVAWAEVDEGSEEEENNGEKEHVVLLDNLPCSTSLETIHLALGGARIRLPTTMKFASLIDLSLERIEIMDPAILAHLVSSLNCPRLQKLRMTDILFPAKMEGAMRLEANELSELWVENVQVSILELKTPWLRSFHIDKCCYKELRVSAPRLEEFAFFQQGWTPRRLEVDGELSCVRSLKICLRSHEDDCVSDGHDDENLDGGDDEDDDDDVKLFKINMNINMLLLKQCSSATCLDVTLESEYIIKSRLPHVHAITSLTINVAAMTIVQHDYGASVASLLMQFNNLRSLSLRLHFPSSELRFNKTECNHQDYWTSHEISMAHLLELELTGLAGTDCELWFMKAVLASAKRLCKVAISFHTKCRQYRDKMDAFECMMLDEGMWTSHRDTFILNSCKTCTM